MLDDPRKVRLGWIAIGWSVAGTISAALLLVLPLFTLWPLVKSLCLTPARGEAGALPGLPPTAAARDLSLPACRLFPLCRGNLYVLFRHKHGRITVTVGRTVLFPSDAAPFLTADAPARHTFTRR